MATENREWALNPLPLIAIVLVAAGVLVKTIPLESARPTDAERKTTIQLGRQDVPARLWQDPFAALGRRAQHSDNPADRDKAQDDDQPHAPGQLAGQVERALKEGEVRVLAVMVFGGTYAEDSEHRRRTRYAVVSGLGGSGYAPEDAQAIGYVWTGEKHATTPVEERLPGIVPYEWFVARGYSGHAASGGVEPQRRDRILVLWLDDGAFGSRLLSKFSRLVEAVVCAPTAKCPITKDAPLLVVGPAGSGTLKVLVRELREAASSSPDGVTYLRFYSAFATLSDAQLGYGVDHPLRVNREWRDRVSILRTIGTDDALARALVAELALRNVNASASCADTVVVVSEWDTEYAREQKPLMEEALRAHCGLNAPAVRWFSYLRGLDGALPDGARGGAEPKSEGKPEKTEKKDDPLTGTVARDRVEGRSQYDYLRRIGDQIEALDRDERKRKRGGVRAVGVLGSDVYDKLLVLQALRPRLPDAIFFTTDLDVRLAHPDQSKWTRNLVVASHFGLALNPGLQREVPPFRDGYQTAAFLATKLALQPLPEGGRRALKDRLTKWLNGAEPGGNGNGNGNGVHRFGGKRIYEIGRTGPIEVSATGATVPCERLDDRCENIHDLGQPSYPTLPLETRSGVLLALFALLGIAALAALTSKRVQAAAVACWTSRYRLHIAAGVLLGAGGAAMLGYAIVASLKEGQGEPFLWLEGVSIWPTLVLYLAASVASAWFLWRGWSWLRHALDEIEAEFQLPVQPVAPKTRPAFTELLKVWILGPLRPFPAGEIQSRALSPYTDRPKIRVAKLWALYRERHTFAQMAPWVLITSGSFLLFAFAVAMFDPPFFPHRGPLARWTNEILVIASITLFIVLLVSVIYITRTCSAFVVQLAESHSAWPKASCRQSMRVLGVPREYADDWMDFNLIVRLTGVVDRLIYCPFIVLLLLVVVRSSLFDALDFPLPAAAVALVLVAYAVFCAAILRRAASKARAIALRNYDDEIIALRGDPTLLHRALGARIAAKIEAATSGGDRQAIAAQLQRIRERIDQTREGAFLPLSQTPVVRALLIPVGGLGGVSLVDWLTIARL